MSGRVATKNKKFRPDVELQRIFNKAAIPYHISRDRILSNGAGTMAILIKALNLILMQTENIHCFVETDIKYIKDHIH